jgi:hypothetical protein
VAFSSSYWPCAVDTRADQTVRATKARERRGSIVMNIANTGGPAFPQSREIGDFFTGMTLRDYFAAQALTGAQIWDAVLNGKNAQFSDGVNKLADVAYAVADSMLKARDA